MKPSFLDSEPQFIWLNFLVLSNCTLDRCHFPFRVRTWFMNTRARSSCAVLYRKAREWAYGEAAAVKTLCMLDAVDSVALVWYARRFFWGKTSRKKTQQQYPQSTVNFFVFLHSFRLAFPDGCELEKWIDLTCISEIAILIKEHAETKAASTVPYNHSQARYPGRLACKKSGRQGRGSGAAG